jgi:hypothetical protein
MSVGILQSPDVAGLSSSSRSDAQGKPIRIVRKWDPEQFAQEQVRGLVRQVFFSSIARPIRQVVFSGLESGTDVGSICRLVGQSLAQETSATIAVVSRSARGVQEVGGGEATTEESAFGNGDTSLHSIGIHARNNLWLIPERRIVTNLGEGGPDSALYAHLWKLRREFEYSVIEGSTLGESSEAAALGQVTDGIILVLAAHQTRRGMARAVKQMLDSAQVRILGTVLSDRTFPIPERIYRRI